MFPPSPIKGSGGLRPLHEGGGAGITGLLFLLCPHQFAPPAGCPLARESLEDAAIIVQIADQIIFMLWPVAADMAAGHDVARKADDEMREGEETGRGAFRRRRDIRQQAAAICPIAHEIDGVGFDFQSRMRHGGDDVLIGADAADARRLASLESCKAGTAAKIIRLRTLPARLPWPEILAYVQRRALYHQD